jgi:hypothetical protein
MALLFTPLKHQTPNHNINGIAGWSNRTIYSYYGSPGNNMYDYYSQNSAYDVNLFTGIAAYTFPNTNSRPIYKGINTFPARYFSTGKNLRVKGRFFISCGDSTPIFNMRVLISDPTLGPIEIAKTNNGNNHLLRNNLDNAPIDYEIMLTGLETKQTDSDTNASTYETFIQANGFYQYAIDDYNITGDNATNAYVPIYQSRPYKQTTGLITNTKTLSIDFEGSANVTNIEVIYLTIEEMA